MVSDSVTPSSDYDDSKKGDEEDDPAGVKKLQKCDQKQNRLIDAERRLVRFRNAVRFGPIFVCRCCERKLFEHQVMEVDVASFKEIIDYQKSGLFSQWRKINGF